VYRSGFSAKYKSGRKKSFHDPKKANKAIADIAGLASGITIRIISLNSLHPSILAASEISSGIEVKNWRSRKIEKALAKKLGTIMGEMKESIQA
jgi:hypothetical protein